MSSQKKKKRFSVRFDAPVTLCFSFAAIAVLILDQTFLRGIAESFFSAPGCATSAHVLGKPEAVGGVIASTSAFNWKNIADYIRLFTHVLGHADWNHLTGNVAFILLLGPSLENRYGSGVLLLMICVTAFVTGVLNACFIPAGLMGASGIAFMMILLSAFASIQKQEVPLTVILLVCLYVGREILGGSAGNAETAHLAGGICGSLFGMITPEKTTVRKRASSAATGTTAQRTQTVRKMSDADAETIEAKASADSTQNTKAR